MSTLRDSAFRAVGSRDGDRGLLREHAVDAKTGNNGERSADTGYV
jgi:hypothetical protein